MSAAIPSKLVNRRDLAFILYELLESEQLTAVRKYADHSRDTFEAALDAAQRLAEAEFAPINRLLDQHEPEFVDGKVRQPEAVRRALAAYRDAGFFAAGQDDVYGGMGLPHVIAQAVQAMFNAANISLTAYPFLTIGNANLIRTFGTDEQRRTWLPALYGGRYFGTMCLSEPQAGSSLADVNTTARPCEDGTYRVFGQKMWISGGDHELAENIVHLVLARLAGAPAGTKGLSLFIVPKFLVKADGTLGARNDVALAGLNHKMGYRGTTNCVLSFGESDGAVGYLVSEPHKGLACMFQMMNEARIGVGLGAAMLAYTGYLHSLEYARSRPQGRPPASKDPSCPQIPIILHADVRRMLLAQKAYAEGALALCLYAASLIDQRETASTRDEQRKYGALLELLTPVVKSWPAQWGLVANDLAIQVHGGYGYTRDYPLEQFYRDNRLNAIHEGTHGIQALDLLGRKTVHDRLEGFEELAAHLARTVRAAHHNGDARLARWARELQSALDRLRHVATLVSRKAIGGAVEEALSNATPYLEAFGHVIVAWLWLRQALLVHAHLDHANADERAFYLGKWQAAAYVFDFELPKVEGWLFPVARQSTTTLDMRSEWF